MTNKTVRPIMTAEARDVLDVIHKRIGGDSRSDSIIKYVCQYSKSVEGKADLMLEVAKYKLISIITSTAFLVLLAVTILSAS